MKLTILMKLMGIMLILTVIPLAILGFAALQDSRALGFGVADDASLIGAQAINESTLALNQLGEEIIRQKAQDTAKELEIYIKAHPTMTIPDLQNDTVFFDLATQPVGATGYATAYDAKTLINRFHKNPKIMNLDMHTLKDKLPAFWVTKAQSEGGHVAYGYYDFTDPDGTIRQKYEYILPLNATTADGVLLNVAATTYIDEFSQPAKKTEASIKTQLNATMDQIKTKTESVGTQNTILMITILTILIVILVSFFFARTITLPVKKLTEVANKVSMGDLSDTEIDVTSNDEIGDLAESFKRMVVSVKYYMGKLQSK